MVACLLGFLFSYSEKRIVSESPSPLKKTKNKTKKNKQMASAKSVKKITGPDDEKRRYLCFF